MIPAGGSHNSGHQVWLPVRWQATDASAPLSGEPAGHAVDTRAAGSAFPDKGHTGKVLLVRDGLMMTRGVVTALVVKASLSAVRYFCALRDERADKGCCRCVRRPGCGTAA
ncbi:hypothetical protein ACLBOM_37545 [Escherichia coli]